MDCVNRRFSVIIPAYNRKDQLINTLRKFSNQKYDTDLFEVIVIDDGSTDGTVDAISLFIKDSRLDINLISQENKGPAHARNRGIEASKYEYIVFLDSDCYPLTDDWLLHINNRVNDILSDGYDDFLLGGRIITPDDTLTQKFINGLGGYGTPDLGGDGFENASDFVSFPTTNLIIPKRTFYSVGGFDENIVFGSGEDTDLCYRLWKNGKIVSVYDPDVSIIHLHRTGFSDLLSTSYKRSVRRHTLLEKYGILSKRCFRRRLIKVIAVYCLVISLLIGGFVDLRLAGVISLAVYSVLFTVFLLRTRNVLQSVLFPIYYVFLSFFEVAGSTIGILTYLKNSRAPVSHGG